MKSSAKSEAQTRIADFFLKDHFSSEEVRKIRALAMKHRIRLGVHRARFCTKCFSDLGNGKTRVHKHYRTIMCASCGYTNRTRIS